MVKGVKTPSLRAIQHSNAVFRKHINASAGSVFESSAFSCGEAGRVQFCEIGNTPKLDADWTFSKFIYFFIFTLFYTLTGAQGEELRVESAVS